MRLATLRLPDSTTAAARLDGDRYVEISPYTDVGMLLAQPDWLTIARSASGSTHAADSVELEAVVPNPGKILCVGLNYKGHIKEMGRDMPAYPTMFAKFADTLTGADDPIDAVTEDRELDWEGELVVVIGTRAHKVAEADAGAHIAGYTVANDISMRGWQFRTKEWLQGKIWAKSTPLGPLMATGDDFSPATAVLRTRVNGETMQEHSTGDLLFTPEFLVSYISTILPLNPGDLILTGTPGGVGRARDPQVFLKAGDIVEVTVDGLGTLSNAIVEPS
ncbi:fumarylacetoacetate hydrolase family protein [Jongsikchunia kroppenstedtii]|uniref:fumarylacetoacetate hydrolase family protein n=1 Tax=Jongsikchunia kroppenstedtii TaxID=1121721 RepID=UPI0003999B9B|nr:fumarylacetoacetate hydrolase family protein [Jongsikchunia kroppenstedtii]